jgi:hypothetical protein
MCLQPTLTINIMAITIKETIEKTLCPVHDIYPFVELFDNKIKIAACCSDFRHDCITSAKKMLAEMDIKNLTIEESY